MNWHLQDAKNNFSKVVQKAIHEGPQTVTLRGKPAAVVISAEEFERLRGHKPSFVEHLLAGPEWDDEMIEEINRRSKVPSRPPIDF
ncbi:MAG: type II toxin-antitoxin system Phd/YefM family antitoxin [Mesorhizobium sp.]|nr:type II toxin-antitoxin system Phd/YefM family antitoxin [Mesorhizobium sp.]MCO5161737.1 type II toxin-antitoxin system Phd/YefM family antitoxin [Mesorhizobium sp.]